MSQENGKLEESSNQPAILRINIPGNVVTQATDHLPEQQKLLVRWFYNYCQAERVGSLRIAAGLIKVDTTTLHRILNGKYKDKEGKPVKLDNFCEKIESFKKLAEARATIHKLNFIETSVSRKIFEACKSALIYQGVVFIFGDSQIGKTTALEQYNYRNNHGQTKLVRMPSNAGVQLFAKELAEICYISRRQAFEILRDRILHAIDSSNLLIIDEIHQCLMTYQRASRLNILEFIREIHDRTKCGLVLCGTRIFKKEIMAGEYKDLLEQLARRSVFEVQLPSKLPRKDLDAVAKAYGLPPAEGLAEDLMNNVMQEKGLGKFTKFLQAASRLAAREEVGMTWDHFIRAHDIIAKLSEGL